MLASTLARKQLINDINATFDSIDDRIMTLFKRDRAKLDDVSTAKQRHFDDLNSELLALDERFAENSLSLAVDGRTLLAKTTALCDVTPACEEIQLQDASVKFTETPLEKITDLIDVKLKGSMINDICVNELLNLPLNRLTLQKTTYLEHTPLSVHVLHGKIWCCESAGTIEVFTDDLSSKRTLANAEWGSVRDVTPLPCGNVVVAGSGGLFEIKPTGDVIKRIDNGNYIGCAWIKSRVYAFKEYICETGDVYMPTGTDTEETFGTLQVYAYSPEHVRDAQPENDADTLNTSSSEECSCTIRAKNDKIYVCSSNEDMIHVLAPTDSEYPQGLGDQSLMSTVAASFGKSGSEAPGELFQPRLGAVDDDGTLLIVDEMNNRLQVVDKDNQWMVLDLQPPVLYPLGAVTCGHKLYVVSKGDGNKLAVYA